MGLNKEYRRFEVANNYRNLSRLPVGPDFWWFSCFFWTQNKFHGDISKRLFVTADIFGSIIKSIS